MCAHRDPPGSEEQAYAGRWVARVGGKIVAQGGTPRQARLAAAVSRRREAAEISYMPTHNPLPLNEQLEEIRQALPEGTRAWLVGGAVRDALLGRATHDLDFVLERDALRAARKAADALGAAYYPMDEERQTARVVRILPDGSRLWLDFSLLRGPDLESDLEARDFTINAIALDVNDPQALLDPLGGAADLRSRVIRACAPTSFRHDPLRILRAVRQAASLEFRIHPETLKLARQSVAQLGQVSVERRRDELFRILDGAQPATALRAVEMLGALPHLLPELSALKGVTQSPPHVADVWNHTLDVVARLDLILARLGTAHDADASANLWMGLLSVKLGRFREQLAAHLGEALNPDRSLRALMLLAALYHDVSKPQTRSVEESGRIRFFEHEDLGARVVRQRAEALHLSNEEISRLGTVVGGHMRPHHLVQSAGAPTRRAVYRFFKACGPAGVDVCLLSLADVLATHGPNLTQDVWVRQLDVVRSLLEAWWEYPQESVAPPPLVNGNDLISELGLSPGREIGRLLDLVAEAQVEGRVSDRAGAIEFARGEMGKGA